MNDVSEYPFHKAAKGSLYVAAVLCIILIIAAPLGFYFIYRIGKAKVTIGPTGLTPRRSAGCVGRSAPQEGEPDEDQGQRPQRPRHQPRHPVDVTIGHP